VDGSAPDTLDVLQPSALLFIEPEVEEPYAGVLPDVGQFKLIDFRAPSACVQQNPEEPKPGRRAIPLFKKFRMREYALQISIRVPPMISF
jgi:hypothetical protein